MSSKAYRTQASGSTNNPLGLDTSPRSYSTGTGLSSQNSYHQVPDIRPAFRHRGSVGTHIALDQQYITDEEFTAIYEKATEAKKLINGFIRYLRQSPQQAHRTTRPKTT